MRVCGCKLAGSGRAVCLPSSLRVVLRNATAPPGRLAERLAEQGAAMVLRLLEGDVAQAVEAAVPQDDGLATHAPKVTAEDGHVCFGGEAPTAERVWCMVRAVGALTGVFGHVQRAGTGSARRIKLVSASLPGEQPSFLPREAPAGSLAVAAKHAPHLWLRCADRWLAVERATLEGLPPRDGLGIAKALGGLPLRAGAAPRAVML